MEKFNRMKKRMIYPETLELDQACRKSSANSNISWINEQTTQVSVDEPSRNGYIYSNSSDKHSASSGNSSASMGTSRQFIQSRLRNLIDAFTYRTETTREHIQMPPTPSSISSHETVIVPRAKPAFEEALHDLEEVVEERTFHRDGSWYEYFKTMYETRVIDPQGKIYVIWMSIAAFAVLYNAWVIPFRSSFQYQTPENRGFFLFCDYLADFIYIIDIVVIQPRIMYLSEGFWVKDINFTKQNYRRSKSFKFDIASLCPLDLFYMFFGPELTIVRFPRFLKMHTFWGFFSLVDKLMSSPHTIRIARTLLYMIYMIHLNACAYYAFSRFEGIGTNNFVFKGKGNAYITCFYFATKTATSIGKNPKPTEIDEFLFMTFSWLMGVFIFALLIGQIRDIIATATRSQTEYLKLVDETLEYMRALNLPHDMQKRVQLWFSYTWETQHTLDENTIMDCLPAKMKTDIAINVHIQTLNKVKLFADCDEALLRELVLQLKSVIYLPGDLICKKGDVGMEMYIIQSGRVQVMAPDDIEVLATLTEGSVFGEISLLKIPGMNRRTANVRSHGYSNLFVLSKNDLNEAIYHYPEAQEILNRKAREIVKKNAALARKREALIVINNPTPPPPTTKFIDAVMMALPKDCNTSKLLRYGSRGKPRRKRETTKRLSLPSVRDMSLWGEPVTHDDPANYEDDDDFDSIFKTKATVHRSMN